VHIGLITFCGRHRRNTAKAASRSAEAGGGLGAVGPGVGIGSSSARRSSDHRQAGDARRDNRSPMARIRFDRGVLLLRLVAGYAGRVNRLADGRTFAQPSALVLADREGQFLIRPGIGRMMFGRCSA